MSVYLEKKHFVHTFQNTFLSPERKGNELKNQPAMNASSAYCPHKSGTSLLPVSCENTVCSSVMKFA